MVSLSTLRVLFLEVPLVIVVSILQNKVRNVNKIYFKSKSI